MISRLIRTGSLALVIAFGSMLAMPSAASAAPPSQNDNGAPTVKHRHGHHHRLTKRQKARLRHWMKHHRHHDGGKAHKGQGARDDGQGIRRHARRHGRDFNRN